MQNEVNSNSCGPPGPTTWCLCHQKNRYGDCDTEEDVVEVENVSDPPPIMLG